MCVRGLTVVLARVHGEWPVCARGDGLCVTHFVCAWLWHVRVVGGCVRGDGVCVCVCVVVMACVCGGGHAVCVCEACPAPGYTYACAATTASSHSGLPASYADRANCTISAHAASVVA